MSTPIRTLEPGDRIYGYARVSSRDQNPERQVKAIQEYIIQTYGQDIYDRLNRKGDLITVEKVSGKSVEGRDGLQRILETIGEGDVLIATTIDRIARSLTDFRSIRKKLRARGVAMVILSQPEFSTDGTKREPTATETLMDTVLAAVAEFERNVIRERQADGIARAKERGVYSKRRRLTQSDLTEIKDAIAGGVPKAEVARRHSITTTTLYKYLNGKAEPRPE
jgi:DNA invertase Pin-like site-specific DNA recombinase